MTRFRPMLILILAALWLAPVAHAARFTYHGDLVDGDAPADGRYDLRLRSFAHPEAKAALGEATEFPAVQVEDGRFALEFDLPENPLGETYVEVAVRKAGSSEPFEVLGAPQAISKANTGCWALDGNTGLPPGSFLGFADPASTQGLELRARNTRVAAFVPDGTPANAGDSPRIALGSAANQATTRGATVSGGGATLDGMGAACPNCRNLASAVYASVGGGVANTASGAVSTVAGGSGNSASATSSTVGGGNGNSASGSSSTVGGGIGNSASGNDGSTVAGGESNRASGFISTVGGGSGHTAGGGYSGVFSGQGNAALGDFAAVLGGRGNCAGGRDSVALGNNAKVRLAVGLTPTGACNGVPFSENALGDEGTFVWADAQGASFTSTGPNQFLVRASGGMFVNTNFITAIGDDLVIGARTGGDDDVDLRLRARNGREGLLYLRDSSGGFYLSAPNLTPGSSFLETSNGAFLSNGGTWTNASSRTLKHGFTAVATSDILQRVLQLPISTWEYLDSGEGRHLGPMAEDFHRLFGLAGGGRAIATVDADGVALAAIQGLNAKLEHENAALRDALAALAARLDAIEAR